MDGEWTMNGHAVEAKASDEQEVFIMAKMPPLSPTRWGAVETHHRAFAA
jgi:hypothetical protein